MKNNHWTFTIIMIANVMYEFATVMYGRMLICNCSVWCNDMSAALHSVMLNWLKSTATNGYRSNENSPSASTADVNKECVRTTGMKNTRTESQTNVNCNHARRLLSLRALALRALAPMRKSRRCAPRYKAVPDLCVHCMPQKSLASPGE